MACCAILNSQSSDVTVSALSDKPASVLSTACSRSSPNPDKSKSSPTIEASSNESQCVADNSSLSDSSPHVFKEPWKKILAQAKIKSRRNKPWINPPGAEVKTYSLSQTPRLLDVINHDSVTMQPLKNSRKGKLKENSTPTTNGENSNSESSISDRKKSLRQSVRSVRKVKRASSVEWDWSGNESETEAFPQNKTKRTQKARKRTASLGSKYSDSEDDDSDESLSNTDNNSTKTCLICNKTFGRPWRLRCHLYRHIGLEGPFVCDVKGCSKTYFSKSHLIRHKNKSHVEKVITFQFECQEDGCHKMFLTGSGLKRHINKVHPGGPFKFQCPQCNKSFPKNKQLRYHIAEHEGQPPIRCKKCKAGFYSDNMLKRHMRSHKEYPCNVPGCEQVFNNYSALRKHSSDHNKCFQSLECAHCNKKFTTKFNLRQHVMTHLENKEVFKCTYDSCERIYYQEKNLRSHIRVKHEKKSSFECPWSDCGKLFLSKRALWKHVNVHENGPATPVKKKEKRAPRKDKGQPKKAMAGLLAGMMVPAQVEKQLLKESTSFKPSDSDSEESPAQSTRSESEIVIPLLIAGSSMERDLSEDSIITSKSIDDKCSTQNAPSSVLLDNSVIENFTGRMFEIGEKGFLVEVSHSENSGKNLDDDPDSIANEAPNLEVLHDSQPSKLNVECEEDCPHSSDVSPVFANEAAPMLSATLCAETIVEGSSNETEREVLLLIPKVGLSTTESTNVMNPDDVVQALSGDVDVYSVAEGDPSVHSSGDQPFAYNETDLHGMVKKVSVTDPSVSSILQPLIEKLVQLPKEKLQDIAKVSFLSQRGSRELLYTALEEENIIKNHTHSSQESEENSSLISEKTIMLSIPAHDEVMVSQLSYACREAEGFEPQDSKATGDKDQSAGVSDALDSDDLGTEAEDTGDPHNNDPNSDDPRFEANNAGSDDAQQYERLGNETPSEVDSDNSTNCSEVQVSTDFVREPVSSCPSVCSTCTTVIRGSDRDGKRRKKCTAKESIRRVNIFPKENDKVEIIKKPVPAECLGKSLGIDETINLRDVKDTSNEIMSIQKSNKKPQTSRQQESKGIIQKVQLEHQYSFDSSDSEPLSEWLKKNRSKTVRKVKSDGNVSDGSISSCFETPPRKKRKLVQSSETDSGDSDNSWKPDKKKSRSKSRKLSSSDSEFESDKGISKKSIISSEITTKAAKKIYPGEGRENIILKEEQPKLPALVNRKSSGVACRQLSESTWIDILRQVNRNMKLSVNSQSSPRSIFY